MLIRGRRSPRILTIDLNTRRLPNLKVLQRQRDQIFGRRRRVRATITRMRFGNLSDFSMGMAVFFGLVAGVAMERGF